MDRPPLHERCLFHKKPDEKEKRYAVFDIETQGLGGAFIAGAWQIEGEEVVFFTDFADLFAAMLRKSARGVVWYMHNGYEYDFKYLLKWLEGKEKGIRVECASRGTRIVRVKLKKQKQTIELRDSFHIFQKSLKEVSKLFSEEEKGYLDFSKIFYNHADNQHRDYLRRDVTSLLEAVRRIDTIIFTTFGQHLRATLPSTSLSCFRTTLDESRIIWRQRGPVEEFCRLAYFGGMVFLRDTLDHENMRHIDFNAMYAAAMRAYGAPVGCATFTYYFNPDKPGFYHVKIKGENVKFPFIPVRLKNGVYYPTEEAETYIDSDTYRFAISVGYEIEIMEGYFFDIDVDMFTSFVDKCESIELAHKQDAIGATMKLLRNSCYGIFGLRPEATTLTYTDEPSDIPAIDETTGEMLFHYTETQEIIQAGYMQPAWAAWITAHARLMLAQAVYAAGVEHVVYGDTDSIVLTPQGLKRALKSGTIAISNHYGDVKIEASYQLFRAFAPKNYQYIKADGRSGGKAKGISRNKWTFYGQKHRRTVVLRGVVTTRTMLKRQIDMPSEMSRTYSDIANSVAWQALRDGRVIPRAYRK